MAKSTIYRPLRPGEEAEVCNLVARSFNEFIAPEFSEDGIEEFFRYANPRELAKRSLGNHITIVAETDGAIAGIIEIRGRRHISMLFVDKEFHRRGIAKELVGTALERIGSGSGTPEKITVNSSTFAVPFYESLGFVQTSGPKTIHGVLHIPMALKLSGGNIIGNENASA
ncbi:MAG: GNAT family N-acetyltransferase [Deltaproteobacteria bacterium]